MLLLIKYILLLLCYICVFGVMIALIVHYYSDFSSNKYIWMCSKILVVQNIVKNNNYNDRVFAGFNEKMEKLVYNQNYSNFLKRITKDGCIEGYKKCGILDTYNNSFCISKSSDCPINKLLFDSSSKKSEYLNNKYDDYYLTEVNNMYLYYKFGDQKNDVIVSWIKSEYQPRYIDNSNFFLDQEAFDEVFSFFDEKEDEDDDDDDDDGGGDNSDNDIWKAFVASAAETAVDTVTDTTKQLVKDFTKWARLRELIKYIEEKFNEESNIDKNYIYIGNNNYVKNYIGFNSEEDKNNFEKIDFSLYKNRYPSYSFVISSIICAGIFFAFMVIYFVGIINLIKNKDNCIDKINFISLFFYCLVFLCFFIYSIVIYATVYNKESFDLAKSIKADKFIEDFLKEFYEPFESPKTIICALVFLSISAILFITAWIIEPIYRCCKK